MIINKRTNYIIEKPEEVSLMPEHMLATLKTDLDLIEFIFHIPNYIKDDHQKVIYKVGFLKKFYSLLYPTMSSDDIYRKINITWQVFLGVRQMARHWNKYTDLFEKKGES